MLNESFSWPLRPIHDGKPLPSDHVEFVFEDLAAPVHDRVISDVFHPRVFAYSPNTPNGRAALVLAGGGYTKLVVGKEGVEVAEWLASLGFHAFVLVHRFPCARYRLASARGRRHRSHAADPRACRRVRHRPARHRRVRPVFRRTPCRVPGNHARGRRRATGFPDRRLCAHLHKCERPHRHP